MISGQHALQSPYRSLVIVFAAWKVFLLILAAVSAVGPCYDTSSSLLSSSSSPNDSLPRQSLVTRLTSWDAIYYVQAAQRGYTFEQEWAFGAGLPTLISLLAKGLRALGFGQENVLEPVLGIIIAHTTHLLSVLVLYQLGVTVWKDQLRAFLAGALHIFSPGGLFLSAPYSESPFSLLSFAGFLCFARSCQTGRRPTSRDAFLLLAGLLFGLAITFRSNGILNGIPFAFAFAQELLGILSTPSTDAARKIVVLGLGGVLVACGSIVPQSLGYLRFCSGHSGAEARPWCYARFPSIYNFVQQHYWNTGFLRYWTISNVPLFLLAGPMTFILIKSGLDMIIRPVTRQPKSPAPTGEESQQLATLVRSAALAQLLLALIAFMSYHVQIITRLSSGYPVWYWWLAGKLADRSRGGENVVYFMVMYASIQGVLFASFLPPA